MSHRLANEEMVEVAMQVESVKRKSNEKRHKKMQSSPSFYLRQITVVFILSIAVSHILISELKQN
jgi:hypothetical protein